MPFSILPESTPDVHREIRKKIFLICHPRNPPEIPLTILSVIFPGISAKFFPGIRSRVICKIAPVFWPGIYSSYLFWLSYLQIFLRGFIQKYLQDCFKVCLFYLQFFFFLRRILDHGWPKHRYRIPSSQLTGFS